MGRRAPRLKTAGLFACLGFLLLVTPAYTNSCTTGCHGMHSDKSYAEGSTYTYSLEGTSVSSVSEGQGEATLKLKADVELAVKPDCIRQVRVKNVQVNGAAVPQPDLEKYALQFNYHHGHIDTELCAEPGDSQASLNIKRAVISLFQSSVFQDEGSTSRHEVDILGGCVTDFTFTKEGDTQIVHKTRNLNSCSGRENIKHGLFSGIMNPSAGITSTPIINGHQKVEQIFKNGVLDKAVSSETYKLRPFTNGEAGAKTVVETTLTFKGKKDGVQAGTVSLPKSLIFEAPHVVTKSSVEAIENALKPVHNDESQAVQPEAARKFSELVRVLRTSSKKDILAVYQKIKSKDHDKKVLLDALYRTGTGEAAEVIVELIKNKEITDLQAVLYYASLSFIQHVNLPSVTTIVTLLDQPNLSRIGYLGIGQIIGKYCQAHPCDNVPEIKSALEKIAAKVKDGKAEKRADEDVILSALKALGNARYLDDGTLTKLSNIAADKKVRNRVRVAAIQALPTKCSMVWKAPLFKIFGDQEEDSEVRIRTYLSLVACPCNKVATEIKQVLDKETIYQVGSFVQSHLRNLRASADPFKQNAKAYLGNIKPRTKFPEDFRKFSANDEFSYNLDAFGVGSTFESNVIFSQNSFVPRSASLNLTTEMFGHSFNFLEIDTRAENLDRIIEHFFGPKGVIPNQKASDAVQSSYSNLAGISNYIKSRMDKRAKRDVKPSDVEKFNKAIQLRTNEVDADLDLDLSIKLFGVELAFLSYEGSSQTYTPKQIVDKIFEQFDAGVNKIKNLNYDLENHVYFLDGEFTYPTALGLALNLGVSGSSVVRSKTNTKIDFSQILADPKNAAFKVAVEPSASIEFVGDMTVADGFGTDSGIRLITTLHTATGYDLNVKVLNGKGVDVSLGVPKKKQEIINISSDVLYTSGKDKYSPIKFGKGKERSDCFDQFTAPLGLTVCGHISYPYDNLAALQKKPFYPLSGPFKFYVTIENNDVTSYHFKTFYNDKNPKDRTLEILLDTPNSKTPRFVSLNIQGATEPDYKFKVAFDSPIKKASVEAVGKRGDKEHTVALSVKNDNVEYFARAGVESLGGNKYKPILEYKFPDQFAKLRAGKGQTHQVTGTVEVADHDGGKKYAFNDVQLASNGRKLFGLDGSGVSTPKSVEVDLKLSYADEKLSIKVDGKRLAEHHYTLTASVSPSKFPANSFGIEWEWNRQKNKFDHKFSLATGADLKADENRLQLVQTAEFTPEQDKFSVSTKNKLSYPKMGALVRVDGTVTRKSLDAQAELKYDKFKFGTDLSGKINTNKPGDYDVEFGAEVLDNKVKIVSKRSVIDDTKSKFENSLKLTPGGVYQADATIKHQIKTNDVNIGLDGEINLNSKKLKLDTGLECNLENLNNHIDLQANGVKYVDYKLKIHKGADANGNLALNLKNYLTATGQYNYKAGKGNGNINIEIPKINRKIKGTGDVTVTGPKHAANFELQYDAEKDPSKKIKVSTSTDLTGNTFDSKNVVEILTYKTEVNAKGKFEGTLLNGKQEADVDVTLPNARYVTFKVNRDIKKKDNGHHIVGKVELGEFVTKGGEGKQLIVNANLNFVNIKEYLADLAYDIKYIHNDKRDIHIKLGGKHIPKEKSEKKTLGVEGEASGSFIEVPLIGALSLDYGDEGADLFGSASRGQDLWIKSDLHYGVGNYQGKRWTYGGTIEGKTPSEKLKNFVFKFDESIQELENNKLYIYDKLKTLVFNDDKKSVLETHWKTTGDHEWANQGKYDSNFVGSFKWPDKPLFTWTEDYHHDLTGEQKSYARKNVWKYGEQELSGDVNMKYKDDFSDIAADGKFTLPLEKVKKVEGTFKHKRDAEKSRKTDVSVTVDGVTYTQSSEIELGESPGIHLAFTCPAGKTELLAKFKKLGENEYSGDYKLMTPKGFVTVDGRVKLESVDDFVVNVNFDSDKSKYRKVHAEIANKPSTQDGRRIFITVTSDGKNLVTGSTNYKRHEEDKKVTLEGSGSLKIGENTKSSSFKYVRKALTREADKEVGVAIMLNASFGPSAIVGELKLSDKEVHVFNSYCEQSKDCAHFKLQSTLDTDHSTHLNHVLQVEVNLKKFNVPVEFGLLSSTKYADNSLDHQANLYLHSSKDRTQYTYHVYSNKRESAAVLSIPSREMAIVAFHDVPAIKHSGAYKIDVSLYLDRKNKPNEKTSLVMTGDVAVDKNTLGVSGETKFTYPSQPKDMIVKGKLNVGGKQIFDGSVDIDVFSNKNDQISASARVARSDIPNGQNVTGSFNVFSKGQALDVKSDNHFALTTNSVDLGSFLSYTDKNQKPKSIGAYFTASPSVVDVLVYIPEKELIKSHSAMSIGKDSQKVESDLSILGSKPVAAVVELKDYNSFKLDYGVKDDAKNKISANGKVVLGQLAEVHADSFKDGAKQDLFHLLIHLDEGKFMKPDFHYNNKNIALVMNQYRDKLTELLKEVKVIIDKIGEELVTEFKDLYEHLKKSQPSLKTLVAYFEGELNKLKNELHADQTIKEIQEILDKTFGGLIGAVVESAKKFAENFDELRKQFAEIVDKMQEAVKAALPKMKESYDKIFNAFITVFDSLTKLATTYIETILKIVNDHQKDIEEIVSVASDIVQDVAKIVFKGATQIEKELREFAQLLLQQVRALPVYEVVQGVYKQAVNYKIPDYILSPVEEFCNTVKNFLPTQELRDFFSAVYNYVLKHAKHQAVDDSSEVKKIYTQAVNAIRSLISLLQSQATFENVFGLIEAQLPVDVSYLKKLPGISTIRFSVMKLLLNGELPTIGELYYTYRPNRRLEDSIPPSNKYGYFTNSGLFSTFDGKIFNFQGTCNYILAEDAKDGNFSVVGEYNNGKLLSVTITDPTDAITIKSDRKVLVNNKPAGYPATTKNLAAHVILPLIKLKSKYGVSVVCKYNDQGIDSCTVRVSGFYHSNVRGFLGNANNEPNDDYILPSGKYAANPTDFGNAYKLNPSCAAGVAKTEAPHAEACSKYFTGNSPLSSCFNKINPNEYRTACDIAVAQGAKSCDAVVAYTIMCNIAGVTVTMPKDCYQCKVGDDTVKGGDTFSVKLPKKQADILFVVEQDAVNEKTFKDLVKPLMTEVRTELKQQGITDVFVGLIGFGEALQWPRHYTSNGNPNIEGGEISNFDFKSQHEAIVSAQEAKEDKQGQKKLKYLRQRLDVELGTFKVTDAYEAAVRYPFRPTAAKAVVGLLSVPCEKSPFSPFSFQDYRLLIGREVYNKLGMTYYHISPLADLEISGKPQKSVVGFDKDSVYSFADNKKKPLEGSVEQKNNLALAKGDVCAGFAVKTGGTAFSSANFLEAKPAQQSQYVKVAARRIAEDIAGIEIEQDCTCTLEANYGWSEHVASRPSCKVVARNDKRHKAKA